MTIKEKIEVGLKSGLITYDGTTVKFGRYAIGGVLANSLDDLISCIEGCCYREDFGGMKFIQEIQ